MEPTISGDTIGARARATALRRLCGAANYATCNAPASRRDGALPAYDTSSPRHSLRRRRTCKRGVRPCASFGWAALAPNKCTSCIRTLRMRVHRFRAILCQPFGGDIPWGKKIAAPGGAAIRLPFQSTVPTTKQMMEHTSMNANSAKVTFLSTPSLPFSLFLP